MIIIQAISSFYSQKPSSPLEPTYSGSVYEQRLAKTQSTPTTKVPELSQGLNDPGFRSLWDSQTSMYKQFLKDFDTRAYNYKFNL